MIIKNFALNLHKNLRVQYQFIFPVEIIMQLV